MSHNKFVSLPVLQVNRSKILLAVIIILHLVALSSVTLSIYYHISINFILGALVSVSFFYYLQYYKKLSTLKMIKYRQDGHWVLAYETVEEKLKPLLVTLETEYLVTGWMTMLRFRINSTKKRTIPLFVDMLPTEDYKKLQVILPYIIKEKI